MTESTVHPQTVLFVDDSRLMRFAARKSLQNDYRVLLADGGEAAIRTLADHPDIDAIVTDLMMPDTDGFDLIRYVRDSGDRVMRTLPILAVTGSTVEGDRLRALELGADDLMTKPFLPAALKERVARLLAFEAEQAEAPVRVDVPAAPNVERSRAGLVERLAQAMALNRRHGLPLTVLHLRLANAEGIEAEHGPAQFNRVMRGLEQELVDAIRVEDTVGRTGRDHYTVVLPATPLSEARHLRVRLRRSLEARPMQVDGLDICPQLTLLLHVPKEQIAATDLLRPSALHPAENVTPLRRAEG